MTSRYQEIIVLVEGAAITVKCRNSVVEDGKRWVARLVPYAVTLNRDGELSERLTAIIGQQFHNAVAVRVAVKRVVRQEAQDG